jgi:UDP-glucose 4-epimerase
MTVLVTGGAGYIGSHMLHRLADNGEPAVVIDTLQTGFREAVPQGMPFHQGSIADRALVTRVLREHAVKTIVHFAASTVVPESVRQPLDYYANNTVASRALFEVAVEQGVKQFVFSSTAAVYGQVDSELVDESMPTVPVSPYGWSKLMTEVMLRDAAAAYGLSFVVLRYFNVAGADPAMRTGQSTAAATHLIKAAVQAALGIRPRLEIFGDDYPTADGTCVRDYIHVSDVCAAHADALTYLRGGGPSLMLNCGYGHGFSVLEVIDTVKAVSGIDFPVVRSPRRAGDPARVVADSRRVRDRLGWQPKYDDLRTIVTHALEWERRLLASQASPAL